MISRENPIQGDGITELKVAQRYWRWAQQSAVAKMVEIWICISELMRGLHSRAVNEVHWIIRNIGQVHVLCLHFFSL